MILWSVVKMIGKKHLCQFIMYAYSLVVSKTARYLLKIKKQSFLPQIKDKKRIYLQECSTIF